jgi:hypothetical protein
VVIIGRRQLEDITRFGRKASIARGSLSLLSGVFESKQSGQDRQCGGVEISDATMERLTEEIEECMMKKRKERKIEGNGSRYLPNP